jgi:hypothetical protein
MYVLEKVGYNQMYTILNKRGEKLFWKSFLAIEMQIFMGKQAVSLIFFFFYFCSKAKFYQYNEKLIEIFFSG